MPRSTDPQRVNPLPGAFADDHDQSEAGIRAAGGYLAKAYRIYPKPV